MAFESSRETFLGFGEFEFQLGRFRFVLYSSCDVTYFAYQSVLRTYQFVYMQIKVDNSHFEMQIDIYGIHRGQLVHLSALAVLTK